MLNGHATGIICKELVRRAISAIRLQRLTFEAKHKDTPGKDEDFLTSADTAAQKVYLKSLQECFPGFGIVAEEDNFQQPCQLSGKPMFFSVDPLDGTKAYIRRQSHGIGTMLALACETEIVSAWVGDVMTQEIYGFRPDSEKVHRISDYEQAERLLIPQRKLREQIVVADDCLCDLKGLSPLAMQDMIRMTQSKDRLFRSMEVSGGSIGIKFARLWKGEIGALLLGANRDTPWDSWPVGGISKKMGFMFARINTDGSLESCEPPITTETIQRSHPMLVVHESCRDELSRWLSKK